MKQFNIEPKILKSCVPAMSKEESRSYLMGIHIFEKDGSLVYEATNGHLLISVVSKLEQEENITGLNIIVPDFLVKELSKPAFLKGFNCVGVEYLTAVVEAQTISIEMPGGIFSKKLIDYDYPDTSKLAPKNPTCRELDFDTIGLNVKYMADIEKSLKALGSSKAKISFGGNTEAVSFNNNDNEIGEWKALLMPLRV